MFSCVFWCLQSYLWKSSQVDIQSIFYIKIHCTIDWERNKIRYLKKSFFFLESKTDEKRCVDIDECALNTHNCAQTCTNTPGGFKCGCKKGYYMVNNQCMDIDECRTDQPCPKHSTCSNTPGSYTCSCNEGFRKEGKVCISEFLTSFLWFHNLNEVQVVQSLVILLVRLYFWKSGRRESSVFYFQNLRKENELYQCVRMF